MRLLGILWLAILMCMFSFNVIYADGRAYKDVLIKDYKSRCSNNPKKLDCLVNKAYLIGILGNQFYINKHIARFADAFVSESPKNVYRILMDTEDRILKLMGENEVNAYLVHTACEYISDTYLRIYDIMLEIGLDYKQFASYGKDACYMHVINPTIQKLDDMAPKSDDEY